jgi:hypothetical protein
VFRLVFFLIFFSNSPVFAGQDVDPQRYEINFKNIFHFFYEDYFTQERSFRFTCSKNLVERDDLANRFRKSTNISNGVYNYKYSKDGKTRFDKSGTYSENDSLEFPSFLTYRETQVEDIDANTHKLISKFYSTSLPIVEWEVPYSSSQSTVERIFKFSDGKRVLHSLVVDGKELPIDNDEVVVHAFDPLGTRYIVTRVFKSPWDYYADEEDNSRIVSLSQTCIYEQKGINDYIDFYPQVLVGEWQFEDYPFTSLSKAKIQFFKDGSFKLTSAQEGTSYGGYNLKRDILHLTENTLLSGKYRLMFNSLHETQNLEPVGRGVPFKMKRVLPWVKN